MAQETLKITITADNKQAVQNIQETVTATTQLGSAFRTLPQHSAQATNALSNLSRVAQDAPYGFMAISNNINPLLESFQRLQVSTGSTSSALKAMVGSLMGPAGIGLAVGVVSSLIVSFGDKLFEASDAQKEAAEKAKEHTEEVKKQKEALDQLYKEAAKEQTQVISLISVLDSETETRERKLKALEALKKINPDIFNGLKLEGNEVKNLNTYYETYLKNLNDSIQLKKDQKELEDIIQKDLKNKPVLGKVQGENKKTFLEDKTLLENAAKGLLKTEQITGRIDLKNKSIIVDLDEQNKRAERRNELIQSIAERSKNIILNRNGGGLEKEVDYGKQLVDEMQMAQYASKRFMDNMKAIGLEMIKLSGYTQSEENEIEKLNDESTKYYKKKLADLSEQSNKTGFGALMMNRFKKDKEEIDADEERQKRLKNLNKKYTEFAKNISTNVTGALFGMYDAMQQGLSVGEALGQMFSRLARSIAESLVQAALFAGILSFISGGASNAANGGVSFFGAFKSVLGLADGGVATGPTLAMIGEGSESEAVLPLSKLGGMLDRTFTAGAMSGNGIGQGGQFVLKGNDLVLALQRSNSSLNLRRGA